MSRFTEMAGAETEAGWVPDWPSSKIVTAGWTVADNVRFYKGRAQKIRGWRLQGQTAANSREIGLIARARFQNGDDFPIIATDTHIYKLVGGVLTELVSGLTSSTISRWELDSFPNKIFLNRTDGVLKVKKWDGATLADVDAAGWGTFEANSVLPRGKYMAQFRNHLMLGCLLDKGNGAAALQSVAGSDIADGIAPEGENDWQFTEATSDARLQNFIRGGDPVQRIMTLGDYLVVYKQNSIHMLYYVGGDYVYDQQEPVSHRGTPSPFSVVGVKRLHYFVSNDNICVFNGSEVQEIGAAVADAFFAAIMPDDPTELWGFDDVLNREIVWVGKEARALVFNYESNTFATKTFPFNAAGYVNLGATIEEWIPDGYTPDDADPAKWWEQWFGDWKQETSLAGLRLLAGDTTGRLWTLHEPGQFQAGTDDIVATLESADFNFGTDDYRKVCGGVRVEGRQGGVNPLELYVGTREHLRGEIHWNQTPYLWQPGTNRIPFMRSGRWFRYRFIKRGGSLEAFHYVPLIQRRGRIGRPDYGVGGVVNTGGCPDITVTIDITEGQVGEEFSAQLTATGGFGPTTWVILQGSLPPGVTLNPATGALTGTPTEAGSYTVRFQAADGNGCPSSDDGGGGGDITFDVCPAISLDELLDGVVGVAYSAQVAASGGAGPYTYAVTSGTLPTGLNLASTGAISGTPTTAGTYNFTITATDANGCRGSRAYEVEMVCPEITLDDELPDVLVQAAYNAAVTASGGTEPHTYAVTSGSLPAGLSLSSAGALTGTPTTAETATFTITATDANGCTGSRAYEVVIEELVLGTPCEHCPSGTPAVLHLTLADVILQATLITRVDCPTPSASGSVLIDSITGLNSEHELAQVSACEWRKTVSAGMVNKRIYSDCGGVSLQTSGNQDYILRVIRQSGKYVIKVGQYSVSPGWGDLFTGEISVVNCLDGGVCSNSNSSPHLPVNGDSNDYDTHASGGTATLSL